MSPFSADLAQTTDYLHAATDLHKIVVGCAAAGFAAKVRGKDPENGAEIGVAYYEIDCGTKAEAAKRATELLRHVRALRASAA